MPKAQKAPISPKATDSLRTRLIRLAHEEPELRETLLPLLASGHKEAGSRRAGGTALYDEYREVQEGFMDRLGKFAQKQGKKDGFVILPKGMKYLVARTLPGSGKLDPDTVEQLLLLFPGGSYTELYWEVKGIHEKGRWNVTGLSPEGVYYQKLKPLLDENL